MLNHSGNGGPHKIDTSLNYDLTNNWVWLVIRIEFKDESENLWHVQGIAADEELAIGMCEDETYLIGPVPMNYVLPKTKVDWIGSYFPLKQDNR